MPINKHYYCISDELAKELLNSGLVRDARGPAYTKVRLMYVYYISNMVSTVYWTPNQAIDDDIVKQLVLLPDLVTRVEFLHAS